MSEPHPVRIPSLVKKYLMAVSGLVLALFVLGHMAGNLQIFAGSPEPINRYAAFLHSIAELLWAARIILLGAVAVHIWMAVLLTLENRAARPINYVKEATVQASYASRTMMWSGPIILAFIIFHLAQYTLQITLPVVQSLEYVVDGHRLHDVYAMVMVGFANPVVVIFYVVAIVMLCVHLSHGASSMFQSLGVRNEKWRYWLNNAALAYGIVICVGFLSVPLAVQWSLHSASPILPAKQVLAQVEKAAAGWDPTAPTPIEVNYNLPAPEATATASASPVKSS